MPITGPPAGPGDEGVGPEDPQGAEEVVLPGPARPALSFPPDPDLLAQGWQARFMTDRARVKELAALYEELGLDVHVASVNPTDLREECGDCQLATQFFVILYTRDNAQP